MPDPRNKPADMARADQRRCEVRNTLQKMTRSLRDEMRDQDRDPTVAWALETRFVFNNLTTEDHRYFLAELVSEAMLQLIEKEDENNGRA